MRQVCTAGIILEFGMPVQIRTSPYDARFPGTNQARNCYTRYNEYYRCSGLRGSLNLLLRQLSEGENSMRRSQILQEV